MDEKEKDNGRLNLRKKIIGLAGIFCVIVLGFVCAATLFLESHYAQKMLLTRLNGIIPGHLSLEKVEIDILGGQVDISGIQVQGPGKVFLGRMEKLSLNLAWTRLLAGEICLSSVLIDSPEFDLSIGEDGSLNLASAFVSPDPSDLENETALSGFPLNIIINELVFARGTLGFSLPDNTVKFGVSGTKILISDFNLFNESVRFRAGFETGELTLQGRSMVVNSSHLTAGLGDGSLSDMVLKTGMDGVDVEIHGGVLDVFSEPVLDIKMGSRVALGQASEIFGMEDLALNGMVHLDLSVKGTLENPGVKMFLHSEEVWALDYSLENFKLETDMNDWLLSVGSSGFSSKQGNLSLGGEINLGKAFPKGLKGPVELNETCYDLDVDLDGVKLAAFPEAGFQKRGRLASRINVRGRGIDPKKIKADITAQSSAQGLWVQGMPDSMDVDFHADIALDKFKAGIRSIRLTTPGIGLTGHGSVDIPGSEISGYLDLEAADIGLLDRLTRVQGRGKINASAEISGPFSGPTVSLSALATTLGINDIFLGNIVLNAGLDPMGRISLDTFSLKNKTSSVHARGWADLFGQALEGNSGESIHFDLDLENVDPVNFTASSPLTGDFNGKIMLGGNPREPVAKVEIDGLDLSFNQTQGGDASVIMGLAHGVVDLEKLQLSLGNSFIEGVGKARILDKNLALIEDPDIELALVGKSVFLEDFFPDITGRLSIDGRVKGNFSDLTGSLNVDGNSLGVRGQEIDTFSSRIGIQGQVLEIDKMEFQVFPGSMIQAKGKVVPLDQTFDIQVDSQNFDLTCLNLFEENGGDSGRLSLDIAAQGSFKDPVVKGELGIQELVVRQEKQTPLDLRVELKNRHLGIKGNLGPSLEGDYHLDTKAFTAALDMADLNLSPYLNLMGLSQFSGSITGGVKAEGRADQLEQTHAVVDVSEIRVAFEDTPFIRVKDAGLLLENRQLQLSSTRIELLEKGSLTVKGEGDLKGELDFEVLGDVPLEVINPLVEKVESATGRIQMNASVKGTLAAPRVQGDFQFNGLGMVVDGLEQDFKNIEGHIKLAPGEIEIIGLKGNLDQGRFDLGGSVGLEKWAAKKFDLRFNAHQLNLDIPDVIDLNLNCDLIFDGTDQASELKGEIVLLEGRYYKDVELDLIAAAARKKRAVDPLQEKSPSVFLQTIGLNVYMSRREALLVDNNLAYLEVSPDLTIKGTAAAPLLAGRAQVDSGYINFQRVEFEVKKGVIDFINPYRIEPTIDIEGEAEIRDWTITLMVSGTPDNLEFKFSSSPSEQHGDILSLIAFGKTTRELRGADSGGGIVPGEILASMVADSLGKGLKESTGLDYLEIDTKGADAEGSGGVDVTVGKELSRQISVKYGVAVRNGETVQRVTTYYKFLENLLMSGYQDTDGEFGAELKYRLEFR